MTTHDVANQWLKAFNKHDLEGLLALYDDDAEHFSPKLNILKPETKGLIKGKTAMRQWWEEAFNRLPGLAYRERSITASEERVFMGYTRIVPGEDNIHVAEALEIKNGRIIASRVYHG